MCVSDYTFSMTIGVIGLGKMGSRIAAKLAAGGHTVHVWNRTPEVAEALVTKQKTITAHNEVTALLTALPSPRIVWVMLPAGSATNEMFGAVVPALSSEDILIDAANSRFSDSDRHAEACAAKSVRFLGIGVSGGIVAERQGYPLMVGGDRLAYEAVKPMLDTLALPNGGHTYFGAGGAGHFVKMVHNGIEYGIMQSLAEGFDVLKHAPYTFDLAAVSNLWQKGTLVSGFLLDRADDVLSRDQKLDDVVGQVAETGEARWTVEQAKVENVPVPIIEASLAYRVRSQTDQIIQQSFTAKLLAAIRNAFGGHKVTQK